jgi:hypothetical protein
MASTDWGFSQRPLAGRVHRSIMWAKVKCLAAAPRSPRRCSGTDITKGYHLPADAGFRRRHIADTLLKKSDPPRLLQDRWRRNDRRFHPVLHLCRKSRRVSLSHSVRVVQIGSSTQRSARAISRKPRRSALNFLGCVSNPAARFAVRNASSRRVTLTRRLKPRRQPLLLVAAAQDPAMAG